MSEPSYTLDLEDPGANIETVGGKGASLAQMARRDLPVPPGFQVTTTAYDDFVDANDLRPAIALLLLEQVPALAESLEEASRRIRDKFLAADIPRGIALPILASYRDIEGYPASVAVRSSATAEDLPELSFAGQQETYLNVRGEIALLEAVKSCWASLWTARAIADRRNHNIPDDKVRMGVVVQVLVQAKASGILFTANPLAKGRSETMINASWGLGDAIVAGRVTPDSYLYDRSRNRIIERRIADKQIITVLTSQGTADAPMPVKLRRRPALTGRQLLALVRIGQQVDDLFGKPVDVEWTLSGGAFAIVQARP